MLRLTPIDVWIAQTAEGVQAGDTCPFCEGDATLPSGLAYGFAFACPFCDFGSFTLDAWSIADECGGEATTPEEAVANLYWQQVERDLQRYAEALRITPREAAARYGVVGLFHAPPGQERDNDGIGWAVRRIAAGE